MPTGTEAHGPVARAYLTDTNGLATPMSGQYAGPMTAEPGGPPWPRRLAAGSIVPPRRRQNCCHTPSVYNDRATAGQTGGMAVGAPWRGHSKRTDFLRPTSDAWGGGWHCRGAARQYHLPYYYLDTDGRNRSATFCPSTTSTSTA